MRPEWDSKVQTTCNLPGAEPRAFSHNQPVQAMMNVFEKLSKFCQIKISIEYHHGGTACGWERKRIEDKRASLGAECQYLYGDNNGRLLSKKGLLQ